MKRTVGRLADGREIIYFDDTPDPPLRDAKDTRDMPETRPISEIRRDPLTGEWVALAAHRQTRTYKPPADLCPLCPSGPDRPTEIPESDYDVAVFENRFPSFAQSVAGEEAGTIGPETGPETGSATVPGVPLVPVRPGLGRCEVVCFTAEHDRSFGELSPTRVRTVVDVWADRTAELGTLPGVEQVFPFENRGEEIGVTLHHPHGQIYAYPFVTPKTRRMRDTARGYLAEHGRPLLGDVLAQEVAAGTRILDRGVYWTAYVPAAARWPVEVHLVPHRQVPDLPALTDLERDDFAAVYLRVLHMMDALYGRPLPYIAAWYQAPVPAEPGVDWLHLQVFSVLRAADKLKYLAGSESGAGVWINDATPEQIAERLRAGGRSD